MMDLVQARRVIEGLLFVSGEPVPVKRLNEVLNGIEPQALRTLVDELNQEYVQSQHALRIQDIAGGYQLVTDPQLAPWMKRGFELPKQGSLSKAALETIAVIAYRQPLTKAEIEAVRGVDVSATLDTLLERQFIRVVGRKDSPGRPLLYGTTTEFLRRFGLKDLGALPPLTHEAKSMTLPLVPPEPEAPTTQESHGEAPAVTQAD